MSEFFMGQITPFAFAFAPRYWALCNGQLLSIQQNTALFSLLGTQYGGTGVTTFALPDLRGRTPLAAGPTPQGGMPMGQTAGVENVTLLTPQLPAHTHQVSASTEATKVRSPKENQFGTAGVNLYGSGNLVPLGQSTCSAVGGNQPHSNIQPYTALNFCIALQGIYPSRN